MLGFALCTWVMFDIRSIEELHIYYKERVDFGLEGWKCETPRNERKRKLNYRLIKRKKVK